MIAEAPSATAVTEQADAPSTSDFVAALPRSAAQQTWAALPLRARLGVLSRARHELANCASELAAVISPELARTPADTLASEVLPLLEACRFLERNAERVLAPQRLGRRGRPFWLAGISSTIARVPFGHVLVIGPANYPLFLPGAQVLQALVAGNTVTWKPGRGGEPVARLCADILHHAGLPRDLLTVTGESVVAAEQALNGRPAKVFFTGSAATGRVILRRLAETATPSVMELSGCDAVLILPSADFARAARALAFGMRLNGSATCMAPRRVILAGLSREQRDRFLTQLREQISTVPPISVPASVRGQMADLLRDAEANGADVVGNRMAPKLSPLLVLGGRAEMAVAQADLFAPVLTVIECATLDLALDAQVASPLALTASVFGERREAQQMAARLVAGTVMINDLIVPTADPRLPFGGRGASGFGSTRGAEGLLEMTQPKVISIRQNSSTRHYDATDARHTELFAGLIAATHGGRWAKRLAGLRRITAAAKRLRS